MVDASEEAEGGIGSSGARVKETVSCWTWVLGTEVEPLILPHPSDINLGSKSRGDSGWNFSFLLEYPLPYTVCQIG